MKSSNEGPSETHTHQRETPLDTGKLLCNSMPVRRLVDGCKFYMDVVAKAGAVNEITRSGITFSVSASLAAYGVDRSSFDGPGNWDPDAISTVFRQKIQGHKPLTLILHKQARESLLPCEPAKVQSNRKKALQDTAHCPRRSQMGHSEQAYLRWLSRYTQVIEVVQALISTCISDAMTLPWVFLFAYELAFTTSLVAQIDSEYRDSSTFHYKAAGRILDQMVCMRDKSVELFGLFVDMYRAFDRRLESAWFHDEQGDADRLWWTGGSLLLSTSWYSTLEATPERLYLFLWAT